MSQALCPGQGPEMLEPACIRCIRAAGRIVHVGLEIETRCLSDGEDAGVAACAKSDELIA